MVAVIVCRVEEGKAYYDIYGFSEKYPMSYKVWFGLRKRPSRRLSLICLTLNSIYYFRHYTVDQFLENPYLALQVGRENIIMKIIKTYQYDDNDSL